MSSTIDKDQFKEFFKSYKFIDLKRLFKLNSETISLNINVPRSDIKGADIRYESQIKQELISKIFSIISNKLKDNAKARILDLRGDANDWKSEKEIVERSVSEIENFSTQGDTLITGARISSSIQDYSNFEHYTLDNKVLSSFGYCYHVGKIYSRDIWVDPLIKWDDNSILIFDKINLEISDVEFESKSESTFTPYLKAKMDYHVDVINPRIIYVITNDFQSNLPYLTSKKRNEKIEYILGETPRFK